MSVENRGWGKKADVCREFGLVNCTIQTTWENRTKIISAFERNGLRIKRFRKPERNDVDDARLKGVLLTQKRRGTSERPSFHDHFSSP
jgi:hypothetical protein